VWSLGTGHRKFRHPAFCANRTGRGLQFASRLHEYSKGFRKANATL
jgi:hypothetical protein